MRSDADFDFGLDGLDDFGFDEPAKPKPVAATRGRAAPRGELNNVFVVVEFFVHF